ncbi:MAG: WG repeat-containing protein [Aureispira sp.]|nr:WG repeat-containing protein [Aureispira sp.]
MNIAKKIIASLVLVAGFSFGMQAQTAQFVDYEQVTGTAKTTQKAITVSGATIISNYQEGVALTQKDNQYGLVNKQGLEISRTMYQNIRMFENGYAAAQKNGKWGFINKQGTKTVDFRYDWVGAFRDGVAPVQKSGKWGYVNEQGDEITAIAYDKLKPFENGQALAQKGDKWFYVAELTGQETPAKLPTTDDQLLRATID